MTKKITKKDAQSIIDSYVAGMSSSELCNIYNLRRTYICKLVQGYSWKECDRPNNIIEIANSNQQKSQIKIGHKNELHASYALLTQKQHSIIIGSLLGDGYITPPQHKRFCIFAKDQCVKFQPYLQWHFNELLPYSCNIKEIHSDKNITNKNGKIVTIKSKQRLVAYRYSTHRHPVFSDYRNKWYINNKKIVPNDLELSVETLAVWYWDDGCNDFKGRKALIYTNGFTIEEANFLSEKIKQEFGFCPKVQTHNSKYTGDLQPILYFGSKNYDELIYIIKPYLFCDCFEYKTKWRKAWTKG